jgi:hypothetical protein
MSLRADGVDHPLGWMKEAAVKDSEHEIRQRAEQMDREITKRTLVSIFIHFHPFSSIFIHFHPFSSIFIHFHPFSSIFILAQSCACDASNRFQFFFGGGGFDECELNE